MYLHQKVPVVTLFLSYFPQVIDPSTSGSSKPKLKDSDEHQRLCNLFLDLVRSRTLEEYEARHTVLTNLSANAAKYIDVTWLLMWMVRIVRFWTNNALHFGLQSTRAEGYYAAEFTRRRKACRVCTCCDI